jgi:hypothetical protein
MTTTNKDLATRTVNRLSDLGFCCPPARLVAGVWTVNVEVYDDSEDGEGSRFIGAIKVNGPRDFEIPSTVQAAIDKAKG